MNTAAIAKLAGVSGNTVLRWARAGWLTSQTNGSGNKAAFAAGDAQTALLIRQLSRRCKLSPRKIGRVLGTMPSQGSGWLVISADGELVATCLSHAAVIRVFERSRPGLYLVEFGEGPWPA